MLSLAALEKAKVRSHDIHITYTESTTHITHGRNGLFLTKWLFGARPYSGSIREIFMYLVCLSVYLTFTDSNALNCNAMHRAMYCTDQVWIGIGVWACESWMKLKLEAGSAAGARLLLGMKRYGTGTKIGISSSSSSDVWSWKRLRPWYW